MQGKIVSHFEILDRLGSGGMGVVYKARDLKLGRTVALKFLPSSIAGEEKDRQRFLREAQAASRLNHPNICTIHEIGEDSEGQLFLCMEICEGETLKARLQRGPLPLAEALEIAIQIASGLARAHRAGIVHRDVKPANVMVSGRNEVKILDFGLALMAGEARLTRAGSAIGTVAYMSPEQARGLPVDPRSDLWSLGAVLYEMLTGEPAFRGDSEPAILSAVVNQDPVPLAEVRPDLPHQLDRLLGRLLAKDPAARFSSAAELEQELRGLRPDMASQSETHLLAPPPVRPVRKAGRRRLRPALAAALGLAALAALALATRPWWHHPGPPRPTRSEEAYNLYLRARDMLEDVDHPEGLDSACELFRKAVEIDSGFALAYAGLSQALAGSSLRDRDPALLAEARRQAERALAADPNLPEAHIALAIVDRNTGGVQESIRRLRRLVALHPELHRALLQLAVSYEEAGDLSKAEVTVLQAVQVRPDDWTLWNQLGAIRQEQGAFAGARQAYDKAIETAPSKLSWPYQNRATLEMQQGDFAAAIAIYERMPRPILNAGLAAGIGNAYYLGRRLGEAEEYYRLALRLQPNNPRWHRNLADVLRRRGASEAARNEYRAAAQLAGQELAVNPGNAELGIRRALYLAEAGGCAEALPLLRACESGLPANPMSSWSLHIAQAYAVCGQRTPALAALRRAIEHGYPTDSVRQQDEFKPLLNDPALERLLAAAAPTAR